MIRDTIVQIASIVFTVACLVVGYILFSWGRTPPAPETFEEFWQQLESQGARYTEGDAEALYALYQERRGQVISSTDGQIGE